MPYTPLLENSNLPPIRWNFFRKTRSILNRWHLSFIQIVLKINHFAILNTVQSCLVQQNCTVATKCMHNSYYIQVVSHYLRIH